MAHQYLKYATDSGICTITLNRPEVYNALNNEITFELQDALKQAARDEQVRVVVLTGEGRAFCSGQDLKASQGNEKRSFIESLHKRYNPIIRAIRDIPKPVIARVNGVAAGAGCSLALACDLIISAEDAQFIEVFINIGLVPDSGSSYFLPRTVGLPRAFELATMGTRVKASEAAAMGLINKAVPSDKLDEEIGRYTTYYATAPTKAIGLIKKMLRKGITSSLDEALDYEAYCQEIAGNSMDYKEGVAAFLEKRKPIFEGK
jgi:2-(1,2-epoxy-1,2-dihydrophenyl)acetyl-CoA isomerase